MFKKTTFAFVSMFLLTSSAAMADDDLLSELARTKGANISDAAVEVEDLNLDFDVDELSKNADGEDVDAIEACFRRFGYRSWGYGYRCFRPYYNCYSYYRPYFCRPIYNYCAPIVRYWGCF